MVASDVPHSICCTPYLRAKEVFERFVNHKTPPSHGSPQTRDHRVYSYHKAPLNAVPMTTSSPRATLMICRLSACDYCVDHQPYHLPLSPCHCESPKSGSPPSQSALMPSRSHCLQVPQRSTTDAKPHILVAHTATRCACKVHVLMSQRGGEPTARTP